MVNSLLTTSNYFNNMGSVLKWALKMAGIIGGSIFATSAVNSIADSQQAQAVAQASQASAEEKPIIQAFGKLIPVLKVAVLGWIGLNFFRNVNLKLK